MIRSLHQLNGIEAFDPKTDLLIVTKIISILYRAKEEHYAMHGCKGTCVRDRSRLLKEITKRGLRFLLMIAKNSTSCLAKGPTNHSVCTIPMCFKGEMGSKNKELFQRNLVENPEDGIYDKKHKVCDYF